jgi:hypothetical protein
LAGPVVHDGLNFLLGKVFFPDDEGGHDEDNENQDRHGANENDHAITYWSDKGDAFMNERQAVHEKVEKKIELEEHAKIWRPLFFMPNTPSDKKMYEAEKKREPSTDNEMTAEIADRTNKQNETKNEVKTRNKQKSL